MHLTIAVFNIEPLKRNLVSMCCGHSSLYFLVAFSVVVLYLLGWAGDEGH